MTISLDRDLAKDLLISKIKQLDVKIQSILDRWDISSIDEFLKQTKEGNLIEAIPDAVSLRNLLDKRQMLKEKLDEEDLN